MKWKKLGIYLKDISLGSWHSSHYSVPIGEIIDNTFLRVYLSGRDKKNRSYTSSVVLDTTDNFKLVDISKIPIIKPGENGQFDDSGSMATWLFTNNNDKFLYYIGWNISTTVPFRNSIGLAIKKNNETKFKKFTNGPILDRSKFDPCFVASCCVVEINGEYFMWYLSCDKWIEDKKLMKAKYNIKLAKSNDLFNWKREGVVCIDYESDDEYAISRPSVIVEDDIFKMWYSTKGKNYKIGYAESDDGIKWRRKDDEVGIIPSKSGWDSEMIEYPHVFKMNSEKYMLYNGNDYGRDGFGIAIYSD